jgi:hypothetical protein
MPKEPTEVLSFWGGVPLSASEAVLLSSVDALKDKPHTMVVHLQGERQKVRSIEWSAISSCRAVVPEDEIVVLGLEGQVYRFARGQWSEEPTFAEKTRPDKFGPLLDIRAIGGQAFAAGYGRQVYRRLGPNRWEIVDHTIPGEKAGQRNPVSAFESIDGFDQSDLYAAGTKGQIWHFDGHRWKALASPTNVHLMALICASDGFAYACGQMGILLRGREAHWEVIHVESGMGHLWDICEFHGRIFCVSYGILFEWQNGELEPVPFPDYDSLQGGIPMSFFKLAVCEDCLWSIGEKDVITFDGREWTRVLPRSQSSS